MTIKEHKKLILKWLYPRRSEGFIDINKFYKDYQIEVKKDKSIQILQSLRREEYITGKGTKDRLWVMLTPEGAEYIEELAEIASYEPIDKFSHSQQEEIAIRLDELATRLHKMEVGQQIIYDDLLEEMETMKKLLNVLGKKDWRQQLQGKLVDQGLGKLMNETIDAITNIFGNQNLLDT
ncbi:MAG: hypothetical protein RIG62_02485 [Cyclobacteriaceae bacterium]